MATNIQQQLGPAAFLTLELSNWEQYSLTERTLYHFSKMNALDVPHKTLPFRFLECVSTKPFRSRKQRRSYHKLLKRYPAVIQWSPTSKVLFSYQMTRIVVVLDATPSLLSTFGVGDSSQFCCSMDRFLRFGQIFWKALLEQIPTLDNKSWQPELAVTILAVYNDDQTSLLVRDFRIDDMESVQLLLKKMHTWCYGEVESHIANTMSTRSTRLGALLDAGVAALSTLSESARPILILASDGRSVDYFEKPKLLEDLKVFVWDLSSETDAPTSRVNALGDSNGAPYPMYLPDDREYFQKLGLVWDLTIMEGAASTHAGQDFLQDTLFAWKRHSFHPNAVQYHYLFQVSNLSPRLSYTPKDTRATISNYIIHPVRIYEILLIRIKEGYTVKQYGKVQDGEQINIQFVLPLDMGTTIHYDLIYRALPETKLVGVAQIRIDLSGDRQFIDEVKADFMSGNRPVSASQQVSARLCSHLRWIRKEDMLHSYLAPLKWSDQLVDSRTPFVRRLASLTTLQRRRHFCSTEFDCVCTGNMPWEEEDFLSAFRDTDNGSESLLETIEEWTTQTMERGKSYVRRTDPEGGIASYCVVYITQARVASRLFTVSIETFSGISAVNRLALAENLKDILRVLKMVEVLPKQIAKFLVGDRVLRMTPPPQLYYQKALQSYHNHATWDLVKDPGLMPLLMRRRKEIGKFLLLESTETHALFAKLVISTMTDETNPGDLVQYELSVHDDKIAVDLHMESEGGVAFFPLRTSAPGGRQSRFHRTLWSLKTRDQERGRALKARTTLLTFDDSTSADATGLSCLSSVKRLLEYASTVSTKLRFFQSGHGNANKQLQTLTEEFLLSGSFGAKVVKLPITDVVKELDAGDWFLVQYDRQTFSIVHLPNQGKASDSDRSLTFFTIGISDLYTRRDDVLDDESDDDHISEHLQVSEFIESVQVAHRHNYSFAAYLALKNGLTEPWSKQELDHIFDTLEMVEVTNAVILHTDQQNPNCSLLSVFQKVIHAVPGSDTYFYYDAPLESSLLFPSISDDIDSLGPDDEDLQEPTHSIDEDDLTLRHPVVKGVDTFTDEESSLGMDSQLLDDLLDETFVSSPIFVAFCFDGKMLSASELDSSIKQGTLSVQFSIFKSNDRSESDRRKAHPSELQACHLAAAHELSALLDAYISEYALERLRSQGRRIQDNDMRKARRCLQKARSVDTSNELFFYNGKSDSIVSASAPEAEVGEGFVLLDACLRDNEKIPLGRFGNGSNFFSFETGQEDARLQYWCLVRIRKPVGVVAVEIHHPEGHERATEVMSRIVTLVYESCHHVNQSLVLKHLHGSRFASRLLIPPGNDDKQEADLAKATKSVDSARDGFLSSPIVHRIVLDLPHRCASNPVQVSRKLEATVLHNFSISNRRGAFVYKDESGSIFYLFLKVLGPGNDNDAKSPGPSKLELIVHGVGDPGPSVKTELKQLLQKRLLQIAVDLFSAVLTNNPMYQWKGSDLEFVRSFDAAWGALESESASTEFLGRRRRRYAFPSFAYDPAMILLFFRQNIFGSGFFHSLVSSDWSDQLAGDSEFDTDTNLKLGPSELLIYYNTSPTKLDPKVQAESTLTEKGIQFSRRVGSGIATIELTLQTAEGENLNEIRSGVAVQDVGFQIAPRDALDFLVYDEPAAAPSADNIPAVLVVDITGTSLNRDVLHDWVMLCMRQVLVAWTIERHLERMQQGLLLQQDNSDSCSRDQTSGRDQALDRICCGFPYFSGVLRSSLEIPHPAILRLERGGSSRASEVAAFALELLERAIFDQIHLTTNKMLQAEDHKLYVIRFSRSSKPTKVNFERDENRKVFVRVLDESGNTNRTIKDSPTDCPEYVMLFYSTDYSKEARLQEAVFPKLFEEVLVGSRNDVESSAAPKSLEVFKQKHPICFRRSFAFILSVKRNRRELLAYNWNKRLFNETTTVLNEIDTRFLEKYYKSIEFLSRRSLEKLAPSVRQDKESDQKEPKKGKNSDEDRRGPKDAKKPPSGSETSVRLLRRPKLIGKSIDGAVMQAVAMSRNRARASSNKFRNSSPGGHTRKQPKTEDIKPAESSAPMSLPEAPKPLQALEKAEMSQMKNELNVAAKKRVWKRQHSLRTSFQQALIDTRWPSGPATVARSRLEFMFTCGEMVWFEMAPLPPTTAHLKSVYVVSLANTLSAWIPEFSVIAADGSSKTDMALFLRGRIRKLRNRRCFVLVRLSLCSIDGKAHVASEGRVLTLSSKRRSSGDNNNIVQRVLEKDSTGVDKLGCDIHASLNLEGALFDHVSSVLERTMKSAAGTAPYNEVFHVLRAVVDNCYPLHPMLSLRSNYKCFESRLFISSYHDKLMDQFDAPSLFGWLKTHIQERNLVDTGPNTVCFKREIVVGSTHTICFWICNPNEPVVMNLLALCRTQGKRLEDFMFREGSNVAITVLGNILVEAAGLAYKELHFAATALHRERLWLTLSQTSRSGSVSGPDVRNLLKMCFTKPILACMDGSPESQKTASWFKQSAPEDILRCCECMKSEPVFEPARTISNEDGNQIQLFYLKREDVFLLVIANDKDRLPQINIVLASDTAESSLRAQAAATTFLNFALHFTWTEMLRYRLN